MKDAAQLLAELVKIDSVSERSNAEIATFLASFAEDKGFEVRELAYEDGAGQRKVNLVASAGPEAQPQGLGGLALVGHTDTVPYGADWPEALNLTEKDGLLYGRGAADTKGFIAAALAAAAQADLSRLKKPLLLVFTADEELGCVGAKQLVKLRALAPRYAIVGEPTGLQPVRAHKGYCLAEVEVAGKECHSAYPELGVSAIFNSARLLSRIEALGKELRAEVASDFEPPCTTLNVGLVSGGRAKNIVPGSSRFTLEWRPVPGQLPSRVADRVEKIISELRAQDPSFEARLKVLRQDQGSSTPMDSPLVRYLEQASGRSSGTVSFGTEAAQLQALGAEVVVFGAGDMKTAHRGGELVPRAQLERCQQILAGAIERFCS